MKMIEAQGKTMDEAVTSGLAQLGLSREDADITILDEATKGFLGIGAKPARVLITEKLRRVSREEDRVRQAREKEQRDREHAAEMARKQEQRNREKIEKELAEKAEKEAREKERAEKLANAEKERAQREKAPRPEREKQAQKKPAEPRPEQERQAAKKPATPRPEQEKAEAKRPAVKRQPAPEKEKASEPGTETTLSKEAKAYLEDILKHMGAVVDVTATENSNGIYMAVAGEDAGAMIGYRGETLDALQYLVSLKVNKGEDDYHRVSLDAEGYRAKREEILIKLAHRLAGKALKTGRKVSLEPMNPYERRILHSALQGHAGVRTHSEGTDPYRRVVITPKSVQRRPQNGQGQTPNRSRNNSNRERTETEASE